MPRLVSTRALKALALLLCLAGGARADAPAGVAGTYRIDGWQDLQSRGLYHFFYLDPGGRFYLAAEWPGSETSRFGGTWSAAGNLVQLVGMADVNTSQGHWTIPFRRTFHMERAEGMLRITPLPERNRFGLMGWPNTFVWLQAAPAVNLPDSAPPSDPKALIQLSEAIAPTAPQQDTSCPVQVTCPR